MTPVEDKRFPLSQLPSYLEWYKCYSDLAQEELIDGRELLKHRHEWSDQQKAKWHFFYRPVREHVGRPQQKEIRSRRAGILAAKEDIARRNETISRYNGQIARLEKTVQHVGIACLVGAIVLMVWVWVILALAPIGYFIHRAYEAYQEKRRLLEYIEQERKAILEVEARISRLESEISQLEGEIAALVKQIPKIASTSEVEQWLNDELVLNEYKCLGEVVGRDDITRETIGNFIRHKKIDERVNSVLIDGWGFLQPAKIEGPYGKEGTGLKKVKDELGPAIASWRVGSQSQPLLRVLYLQYVFLLERNINVYSLFYDFITRKWYGKRCDTFQYNHVATFSIREVEIEAEAWVHDLGLAPKLTSGFFGKDVNVFTLVATSGERFRCVLVDDQVTSAMNEWMEVEQKYEDLVRDALPLEEIKKQVGGDDDLARKLQETDRKKREELRARLLQERQKIDQQDINRARAALQQVRNSVEQYQQHVVSA